METKLINLYKIKIMSSYKYDSNLKSVPDANITVVLE